VPGRRMGASHGDRSELPCVPRSSRRRGYARTFSLRNTAHPLARSPSRDRERRCSIAAAKSCTRRRTSRRAREFSRLGSPSRSPPFCPPPPSGLPKSTVAISRRARRFGRQFFHGALVPRRHRAPAEHGLRWKDRGCPGQTRAARTRGHPSDAQITDPGLTRAGQRAPRHTPTSVGSVQSTLLPPDPNVLVATPALRRHRTIHVTKGQRHLRAAGHPPSHCRRAGHWRSNVRSRGRAMGEDQSLLTGIADSVTLVAPSNWGAR
jgi:hypothetical protein